MKKWFRFSLLTLVLLHFEAAGLLWANLQVRETTTVEKKELGSKHFPPEIRHIITVTVEQGWPMVFYRQTRRGYDFPGGPESTHTSMFAGFSIFNPFVWLGMLGATAAVSEFFVRRRAKKIDKPN